LTSQYFADKVAVRRVAANAEKRKGNVLYCYVFPAVIQERSDC
jgi:hypothetical protein